VTSDLRTAHRRLRYTGRFPPLRELRFANWELALDEDGRPGQDETTLRPALEQRYVSRDTAWSWLVLRCPYSGRRVWRVEAWSKAA
jgi:hypothetical protein